MKALDRKLLRDFWALKTQVISIALVIGCGIGGFVASFSTHDSLVWSRQNYYDTARFPHVFAEVKRAPETLAAAIGAIRGVTEVETRLVHDTLLDVEGVAQPMTARMIGMKLERTQAMNRVTLKSGRWPAPGARGETVVNDRFAEARHLAPGAQVHVLLNGKHERLTLVGTALSPEYIYATRGGMLPDDEWFAIFWIDEKPLAAAFDMEGAFNSVLLRLQHGTHPAAVMAALDALLDPYGTRGAYGRDDQISAKIVTQEIEQQRVMGTVLPSVFLLVAAFILNVVLHRQVNAQRGEIAALKALGYDDAAIAWHYLKFTAVVVVTGAVFGVALGNWLGYKMTLLYTDFFHFPDFHYRLLPSVVIAGTVVALMAGFGGAIAAIRGVVKLKPAEALRPPTPASFKPLMIERLGYARLVTPAQRMVLRNLERRPGRALLTVAGIAGSVAILIAGTFWTDAVDHFIDVQFRLVQPADVYLGFTEPVPQSARFDLGRLPGVLQVELWRSLGARLRAGHRSYRGAVTGLDEGAKLQRIVDADLNLAHPEPGALLLTARLARKLGVAQGDSVTVEFMDGKRKAVDLKVGATIAELAGLNAWMRLDDLTRVAGESPLVSTAALVIDRSRETELLERLKQTPGVAVVIVKRTLLETFRATSARNLLFFTAILTVFASVIAVGVVYNNARIQLAERTWELASLRVVGLTRGEVSVLLLGELALEIIAAIPLGFLAGRGLAKLLVVLTHGEAFDIPLMILPGTYAYAGTTVMIAGIISALIVRHRIDHLDLVAVLKTRE